VEGQTRGPRGSGSTAAHVGSGPDRDQRVALGGAHRPRRGVISNLVPPRLAIGGKWVECIAFRAHGANTALDVLYVPALGPDRDSWAFLIKRTSLLLLSAVSKHPRCVTSALPLRSQ